jgi:hypothetical protein
MLLRRSMVDIMDSYGHRRPQAIQRLGLGISRLPHKRQNRRPAGADRRGILTARYSPPGKIACKIRFRHVAERLRRASPIGAAILDGFGRK